MVGKLPEISNDALVWKGRRFQLTQPYLIGRGSDNDMVFDDKEVSRRHAMVYRQGNDWWLSDLGSRNGLRVNGIRLVHARLLRDGDELHIGAQSLRFISDETESRRTAVLVGETTQMASQEHQSPLNAGIHCELIVAAANGEILEGEKAARWFFGKTLVQPSGKTHSFLPPEICTWLGRQNAKGSQKEGVEMELLDIDRRVIVNLCRSKAGRYFLLVREESTHAFHERLQALGLSPREAEVMQWICEGKTNPEIAVILKVTIHTINRHVEHILSKLGVENRQMAIVSVLDRTKV